MKYISIILLLLFSHASLGSGEFPDYMIGEWESIDRDPSGESYHYTLLELSLNSGKLLQNFHLQENIEEVCIFKIDETSIASDIYHLIAEMCNEKTPNNKRAILLIPQNPYVMELKVYAYGSKNYRTELFSTYLNKVENGEYLKERLITHEKDH